MNAVEQKDNALIIDLNNSQHARPLAPASILHRVQFEVLNARVNSICGRIQDFTKRLQQNKNAITYERYHDVITVHGKRGSGKTTFLLSALQDLQNNKEQELCVLGVMDPTLFGLKEHILLAVISKIAEQVRAYSNQGHMNCSYSGETPTRCKLEEWQRNLEGLAKGLKRVGETRDDLDDVGLNKNNTWDDPAYFLQDKMESAQKGLSLEQEFHHFLHFSLQLINKKAFVLALDDIDTRPNIGWHVLEVLRKYFTSPQLIVILSGDLDLFTTIIRKKQLEVFGLDYTSPPEIREQFHDRVEGLTEQFLLKILRSNYRINIGSFHTALLQWKKKGEDAQVYVHKGNLEESNKTTMTLQNLLERLYSTLGCYDTVEQRLFRQTLFANSCRTVVQVLDALWDFEEENLTARLCEIFYVALQNMGFEHPTELPEQLHSTYGLALLMEQLFTHSYSEQNMELLPSRTDTNTNNGLLALQANITQAMQQNMSILFAHIFKSCLLYEFLGEERSQMQWGEYTRYANYLCLETEEPNFVTIARIIALQWQDASSSSNLPIKRLGTVRLYGQSIEKNAPVAMKAMYGVENNPEEDLWPSALFEFCSTMKELGATESTSSALRHWVNTPESLWHGILSWQSRIISLGVFELSKGSSNYRFFSVFPILALMNDIIAESSTTGIQRLLQKASQIQRFPLFGKGEKDLTPPMDESGEEVDETDEKSPQEQPDIPKLLLEAFANWAASCRKTQCELSLPATLSTRIMRRFLAALERIDDNFTQKNIFAGEYIHRCIIAFFNSVLVEECLLCKDEKLRGISLALEHPVTDDWIFVHNLFNIARKLEETTLSKQYVDDHSFAEHMIRVFESGKLPLFQSVTTFPLWGLYLQPEDDTFLNTTFVAANGYHFPVAEDKELNGVPFKEWLREELHQIFDTRYYLSEIQFPNLYILLNTLAIPKTVRTGASKAKENDQRTIEGKLAKLPASPKINWPSKLIEALYQRPERHLLEPYRDLKSPDDEFRQVYESIVALFYREGPAKAKYLEAGRENDFWRALRKYFEKNK